MVRAATIDDLEEMSELWINMMTEINPKPTSNKEWWLNYHREMMKTDVYYAFVAFDDKMIGYIAGQFYPDATTGELVAFGHDFFILPEYRDTEIASKLYGKLVRTGKAGKADAIEMTCFEGQIELWKSKGYDIQKYHMRRAM